MSKDGTLFGIKSDWRVPYICKMPPAPPLTLPHLLLRVLTGIQREEHVLLYHIAK